MNINWEDLFFYQVIDYRTLPTGDQVAEERRALIRNMWTQRIEGAKSNVEVDRAIILVHTKNPNGVYFIELYVNLCRVVLIDMTLHKSTVVIVQKGVWEKWNYFETIMLVFSSS